MVMVKSLIERDKNMEFWQFIWCFTLALIVALNGFGFKISIGNWFVFRVGSDRVTKKYREIKNNSIEENK